MSQLNEKIKFTVKAKTNDLAKLELVLKVNRNQSKPIKITFTFHSTCFLCQQVIIRKWHWEYGYNTYPKQQIIHIILLQYANWTILTWHFAARYRAHRYFW